MFIEFSVKLSDPLFGQCYDEAFTRHRSARELRQKYHMPLYRRTLVTNSLKLYFARKYPQVEEWPHFELGNDYKDEHSISGQFFLWDDEEKDTLFRLQIDE